MTSTLFIDDEKMHDRVRAEFHAVSLSRRCITRRADEITLDIEAQLKEDIASCQFYSLCLDESCDITDIAQLAVFIRMFFFRRLHKGRVSVFGALVVDNT